VLAVGKSGEFDFERILNKAVALGASYADVRYQYLDDELVTVENKELKTYSSRRLSGAGIRIVIAGAVGYASTSDLRENRLEKSLRNAIKAAKSIKGQKHLFAETKINKTKVKSTAKIDPCNVPPEDKVSIVLDANKNAWISNDVKNATTRLGLVKDFRQFTSSEGTHVEVETTLVGLSHASVAKVNGAMESVNDWGDSRCAGFEFIKCEDWNSFTAGVSKLAIEAAKSGTPPPGTYPVVVDPEVLGLVLHEAFGHASEGDIVSSGDSVLRGKLGDKLASDMITIIDEGTIEGGYFYPFDDEGTKKEKTVVVEDGVLKNFLNSRNTAHELGGRPTGNARAQDFDNLPIVRQTNYYLQPRDVKFEEMIEGIDFGIYVRGKGAGGGEVEPGLGTFTFGVGPSKVIRKGELAETVKGVVISGSILDTLKTVDAAGKDLKITTNVFGGCGKEAQRATVGFGGPHVRVRKMTVGGR
jgi:TldD protein